MKRLVFSAFVASLVFASSAWALTEKDVQDRVNLVCGQVKTAANPQQIFDKIIAGEHPYKDKDDASFYVFVYDDKVTMLAHPTKKLVGENMKGKPDVRGKMFRDKIVEGALADGTGWVKYTYQKPGESVDLRKKAYYQLCPNAGKKFVVVSGMYDE